MTDTAQELPLPAERPPTLSAGVISWLRANLFDGIGNTLLTLAAAWLLVMTIPPLVRWAVIDAVWRRRHGRACRGDGACWAFIGEAALHPVRPLPLCRAVAAAGRRADLHRADPGELRPSLVGPAAGRAVARGAGADRGADVGRHPRPELCRDRSVERAAADPDPRRRRHGARLSAGDPAGARAALAIAGGARDLRRLYRADPRRAADHRAVHGLGDAAAVPARRA